MSMPIYLGIEIGGTKLQLAIGHGDGKLLGIERRRIEPERGAAGILQQVLDLHANLFDRHDLHAHGLGGVGIGFGGPVDRRLGITTTSHQVEGWDRFPLVAWARDRLGTARVILENDADLAALGESRHGAGIGFDPMLYVTVGSGIGGGLIVDGQIYRGNGVGAIEIGHLIVDEISSPENDIPVPPDRTVEQLASGWSISRRARRRLVEMMEHSPERSPGELSELCRGDLAMIDVPLVARGEREGDPICREVMQAARSALARGLSSAITLLAPRRVVLGGGVSLLGEQDWFAPIRDLINRWVFPGFLETFDVVPATLAEEVVLHGAIEIAVERSHSV